MPPLADLHRAVRDTLASKRLGRPVFVRYLVQGLDGPEAIVPRLTHAAMASRGWLGQTLDRVYVVGSPESGQVAATLLFREGGTALVTYAHGEPRGPGVDLVVLGNHGALYFDAGDANPWEAAEPPADPPDPAIKAALERALHSGAPEPVAAGGQP